jgi:phospholipid-binding lipoprotein MlaA
MKKHLLGLIAASFLGLSSSAIAASSDLSEAPASAAAAIEEDDSDLSDPWEATNRDIHDFNRAIDDAVIEPAARGYRHVVPEFGRRRVSDFFGNAHVPMALVDHALAGNGDGVAVSFMRFMINTTFGVAGLFDVASEIGIPKVKPDFGKTLAAWGAESGPYVVLPVFGPSTVRDAAGRAVDMVLDPVSLLVPAPVWVDPVTAVTDGISKREAYLDEIEQVRKTSLDEYATMKSLWMQVRQKEVDAKIDMSGAPSKR